MVQPEPRSEMKEPQYFGVPGQCFDVNGDWWHTPGSVVVDPGFERWLWEGGPMPPTTPRHCCGIVGVHDQGAVVP